MSVPLSARGVRHIALKTRDLATTERFYVDVLGLVHIPHEGMLFLETPGGSDILNFIGTEESFDPRGGGLDHFGIRLVDFHPQQTIVMRWLLLERNGEPLVVGIELL